LLSERLSQFPDCERAVVSNAGHFMAIEQPQATADLVLAFLDR
jgi:pimeloyl-ACP methyl ester carboxylesterase